MPMTSPTLITPLRYETPSVTLEVMARPAAISQWSERPVVQILRYQLHIRSLHDGSPTTEISGDRASFVALSQAVQQYIQAQLGDETGDDQSASNPSPSDPYLEPNGLTRHTLHLGGQRTMTGAQTAAIGAVQLADLGTAFDQLEADVRLLPISLTPQRHGRNWRSWGAAAAGIVAAVGVTTALWPTYRTQQAGLEAPVTDSTGPEAVERSPMPEAQTDRAAESAPTTSPQDPPRPNTEADAELESQPPAIAPLPQKPSSAPSAQSREQRSNPAVPVPAPKAPVASSPPQSPSPAPAPSSSDAPSSPPSETALEDDLGIAAAPAQRRQRLENDAESMAADGNSTGSIAASEAAPQPQSLESNVLSSLDTLALDIASRWNPPDTLTQPLTYTLVVNPDGRLAEILPENTLAEEWRDRVGLPAIGTQIVPANEVQQFDLQFLPTGEVQPLNPVPFSSP